MNNITHAFKQAGVKLPPLTKRIWLWLHDHPAKTYSEVANALNEKPGYISSQLGLLVKRGMVRVQKSERHSRTGRANVNVYSTCIKEFEMLPMPLKPKAKPVADFSGFKPEKVTPVAPPTSKAVQSALDNYTLKELRAIREALNHLFEYV